MNKLLSTLLAIALSLAVGAACAQDKNAGAAQYKDISWDELVPADWDPLKQFKGMNFGVLTDADPRAAAMLKRMRETWDNAPVNMAMDGKPVRVPGYLVPLEEGGTGVKEFLLVPYFGACIHSPPPPSNQIIHVLPARPAAFRSMDTVWVTGKLQAFRSDTFMGASGYRIQAAGVEALDAKSR